MIRRVHIPHVRTGQIELDRDGSHHLASVLRLTTGAAIELFDDAGATARGTIVRIEGGLVVVQVTDVVENAKKSVREVTIASAVPKGERADWMIEKLSELGVTKFLPLAVSRSVVLPEGKNKRDRWIRIATESAKQSRRAGVMQIGELTPLAKAIEESTARGPALLLSTDPAAASIVNLLPPSGAITLFVGPEGGWTDAEIASFAQAGVRNVKLTDTILRVETAAIAAATIACVADFSNPRPDH